MTVPAAAAGVPDGVTVAVRVSVCPYVVDAADRPSVVAVDGWVTVCVVVADVALV